MMQLEIIGHLGRDAEVKDMNGHLYTAFSVGCNEYVKDATGNRVQKTVWIQVYRYGNNPNLIQYLRKGAQVFVRGTVRMRTYTDANGNTQIGVNLNASELQLCGSRSDSADNPATPTATPAAPPSTPTQTHYPAAPQSAYQPPASPYGDHYAPMPIPPANAGNDDLPF